MMKNHHPCGGSRTAATSKMEHFVIIINGFHPLTIIIKHSILDVARVLDPLLHPVVTVQLDHYFLLYISRRPMSQKCKQEYLPTRHIPPLFNSLNKFQVAIENKLLKTTTNSINF